MVQVRDVNANHDGGEERSHCGYISKVEGIGFIAELSAKEKNKSRVSLRILASATERIGGAIYKLKIKVGASGKGSRV